MKNIIQILGLLKKLKISRYLLQMLKLLVNIPVLPASEQKFISKSTSCKKLLSQTIVFINTIHVNET